MIRIAITPAAFDAIAATLSLALATRTPFAFSHRPADSALQRIRVNAPVEASL